MNIILLQPGDFTGPDQVSLRDRRAAHIHSLLKPEVGNHLKVGIVNGSLGSGEVLKVSADEVVLRVHAEQPPPPNLPLTLLLALPRPRMLGRILQVTATFGVESLWLIQTARVEKSFWQTPLLAPDAVAAQFDLGLEQARATQRPHVRLLKNTYALATAVEQLAVSTRIALHPGPYPALQSLTTAPAALAIGPEGGFSEAEIELLQRHDFAVNSFGERILRVETAVVAALARMFM